MLPRSTLGQKKFPSQRRDKLRLTEKLTHNRISQIGRASAESNTNKPVATNTLSTLRPISIGGTSCHTESAPLTMSNAQYEASSDPLSQSHSSRPMTQSNHIPLKNRMLNWAERSRAILVQSRAARKWGALLLSICTALILRSRKPPSQ